MPIYVEFDASGYEAFSRELERSLAEVKKDILKRSQQIMARSVDQAFLSRGYPGGRLIGPTIGDEEPRRQSGGRWKKHRPSTIRSREAWAKRNGPPAGEELRLTDSLREAASDTTGSKPGSAAYIDEKEGIAAIGVELSVFPGAAAHQWGYTPRNLVARPFLGLTVATERQIIQEAEIDLAMMAERVERRFNP